MQLSKLLKIAKCFRTLSYNIQHAKYKIDIMKEELSNINMAIHLAKSNIVNTFIYRTHRENLS